MLATTFREAMRYWDRMKADNVSLEDRVAYLANVLKETWPRVRAEPWHYLCEDCHDTGYRVCVCATGHRCDGRSTRTNTAHERPGRFRRMCTVDPTSEATHEYVEPCSCAAGEKRQPAPPSRADDLSGASKATPKPQRLGRW